MRLSSRQFGNLNRQIGVDFCGTEKFWLRMLFILFRFDGFTSVKHRAHTAPIFKLSHAFFFSLSSLLNEVKNSAEFLFMKRFQFNFNLLISLSKLQNSANDILCAYLCCQ